MAMTLVPVSSCAECADCGEPVEHTLNGELVHVDTDRIHCLWPRPRLWRRIAGRA